MDQKFKIIFDDMARSRLQTSLTYIQPCLKTKMKIKLKLFKKIKFKFKLKKKRFLSFYTCVREQHGDKLLSEVRSKTGKQSCSFKNKTLDCKSPQVEESRAGRPIRVSYIRRLSRRSSHQEVNAFKKAVLFVCLLFQTPKESRTASPQGLRLSREPVGQKELLEFLGVFLALAPGSLVRS